MAQWSHADRTLHAKLVYYGPAFGGKTTNLEALHRVTDPDGSNQLLSVKTSTDRTLFFDLLPFDLGDILGYQVALKLYTVPGQVRYDTTRQVVLSGADALVFVADSCVSRREQCVWSLQNLQMNMRAKGLDPRRVPVLFQFNKQDLPDAAPPAQVAGWLGIPPQRGFPAVAVEGRGVLDTFMAATRAMIEKLVAAADDRTRRRIDSSELARQVERAFAPYVARAGQGLAPIRRPRRGPTDSDAQIVLEGEDLLERSVQTSVKLGERLTAEVARSARLEREAAAYRRLSEMLRAVGANFDRETIVDTALEVVAEILDAPVVTVVGRNAGGEAALERSFGREFEPLLQFDEGRALVARAFRAAGAAVVEEFCEEFREAGAAVHLAGLRGAATVPLEPGRMLIAYSAQPDGLFREPDVRFMANVCGHLAVGSEKARLYEELERRRDSLEEQVAERTEQLRTAYESLRRLDEVKHRFLNNISHEMKTPLTAILSAAHVLRNYDSNAQERREMVASICGSAETLERQLENLLRLANLEPESRPADAVSVAPRRLVEEAIQLAGHPGIQFRVEGLPDELTFDLAGLARAVANLIDNAVKFSPPSSLVKVVLGADPGGGADRPLRGLVVSVLDRGPGVPEIDRERIFAPFEQGGDPLTGKPSGMGIGLHEARAMAVRHGGSLEHREREGGGSEFRLWVPLDREAAPAALEDSLV